MHLQSKIVVQMAGGVFLNYEAASATLFAGYRRGGGGFGSLGEVPLFTVSVQGFCGGLADRLAGIIPFFF
jgi:hypothetical protein